VELTSTIYKYYKLWGCSRTKDIPGIDPYDDDEDDTLKVITGFDDAD